MTSSVKCDLQCADISVLLQMSSYSGFQRGQVKDTTVCRWYIFFSLRIKFHVIPLQTAHLYWH